ncbi:MAG: hypothetical protein GXO83_11045 [Chlorobi bacterium]|nr:hypothetical protein [Chlorobiota bacterium]
MIIDNRHLHVLLWLKNLVSTIIFVLLVFAIYLTSFFENLIDGIGKNAYTIFLGIIYIVLLIYPNLFKYHYIYFSDNEGKIVFNFYPLGFFEGKKQSIRIPVKELYDIEIRKSFLGIRKSIILYRKMGNKIAKYPPIYLSSLSDDQRARIINTLDRLKIRQTA